VFLVGPRADAAGRPPTRSEARILDLLREKGPLTQREIAGLLDVTPQAVSYHMQRLRREGHAEPDEERRWSLPVEIRGEG
jgi:predicted transcriptional regulator